MAGLQQCGLPFRRALVDLGRLPPHDDREGFRRRRCHHRPLRSADRHHGTLLRRRGDGGCYVRRDRAITSLPHSAEKCANLSPIARPQVSGSLPRSAHALPSCAEAARRGPRSPQAGKPQPPIEPSKWTPTLPSLSKSDTFRNQMRGGWPDQVSKGRRWSASRLPLFKRSIGLVLCNFVRMETVCALEAPPDAGQSVPQTYLQYVDEGLIVDGVCGLVCREDCRGDGLTETR